MGKEIERKYLLKNEEWRPLGQPVRYRQGYLSSQKERVVRVRTVGERGFLTIKGPSRGATRSEYEYEIPRQDAEELLDRLCEQPLIEKTRTRIPWEGLAWEVDEFFGDNAGLVLAEIELPREDHPFTLPGWIGEEVTLDPRYFNSNLIRNPYTRWPR